MKRFRIVEHCACYVDFIHEIEADSQDEAMELFRNGAGFLDYELGDNLDSFPATITLTEKAA